MPRQLNKDIIIIGGGIAGSVLASSLLAQTNFSIAVVEASPFTGDETHPGFDARVIALASHTVSTLSNLGVSLPKANGVPIEHIQVTDKGHSGVCELHASDHGANSFGQVVSLNQLGYALNAQLKLPQSTEYLQNDNNRLHWFAPALIDRVNRKRNSVSVVLGDETELAAKLVVLADGGRSPWAEKLGFDSQSKPYDQSAIICNVEVSEAHKNWAYERFTKHGPLAFLPYNGGAEGSATHGFSVVWALPPQQANKLLVCDENTFIQALQSAFGYRQGRITKVGSRHLYPLSLAFKANVIQHRSVAVGNAAQALHPIAGQGFNLGLRDVSALAKCLSEYTDPGEYCALHRYSQGRMKDRTQTIGATDSLVHLFSNNYWPTVVGRNLGLIAMDNKNWMKQVFVSQAMGHVQSEY